MNTHYTRFIILILFLAVHPQVFGNNANEQRNPDPVKAQYLKAVAADCLPATAWAELNIGGVRARINNGGDMWWDLMSVAEYEVPKGSHKTSLFAGALWIGGVDANNNLKLAAQQYRMTGIDFWPGPLTADGTASTDASICHQYDNISVLYRQDVVNFLAWWANPTQFPTYSIPSYFFTYPAHGNPGIGQSYYLAPFYDNNEDGKYNPTDGDYPYYDIYNKLCNTHIPTAEALEGGNLADQVLKGDQTLWWVFNDKGNIHTESGGEAIGLEIRAQAFAFHTANDINNATFYTYEIVNRSSSTLYETHVALFTDPSIGYDADDYIGCDVPRGLGYCYNGDDFDENGNGAYGYGSQPPAVGIDFLQGPYMDPDGVDNPAFHQYTDTSGVIIYENCNEALNGVNFGNGIIDDERLGMQRFISTNCYGSVPFYNTCPETASDYYNFMKGIFKDGTHLSYGGNGHSTTGAYGPDCNYMFPGLSDFCNYGTGGIDPNGPKEWTELAAGNYPNDRRFNQSAGPFTMHPGAVNYVTIGVPWARALSGGSMASLDYLLIADDKCQALFDNCFKTLDGPSAPSMTAQELDREIILFLSNDITSNNYKEQYEEFDPTIIAPNGLHYDSLYRFEGYQIFQVSDASVTGADIYNADKARLVAQCDIMNETGKITNYVFSDELDALIAREEVDGENKGLIHSFRILEDQFATGNNKHLVNNRKYYFLVVAYAYNEYEKYTPDPNYQLPGIMSANGQKAPYLSGRRNVQVYTAIPHSPESEAGGTQTNCSFGDQPGITRIEGQGNGGNILELSDISRNNILIDGFSAELTYEAGFGPVNVTVIDPLNVKSAKYILKLDSTNKSWLGALDSCTWTMEEYDLDDNLIATYSSDHDISSPFEQIFPDLGIAVTFVQGKNPGDKTHESYGFLTASVEYSDPDHPWLSGVADVDGSTAYNWIRSGMQASSNGYVDFYYDGDYLDPKEYFEKINGGTWAPFRLVSDADDNPASPAISPFIVTASKLSNLASVDIVLTPDKNKWSRCPVLETCDDPVLSEGNAEKLHLRVGASVDKNGNDGTSEATYDGNTTGMGWFPGYAINVETGERLNIAFGEDSWLSGENGNDMVFNPTSNLETTLGTPLFGGKHYIYVFEHLSDNNNDCPAYDEGEWLYNMIADGTSSSLRYAFTSAMWCSIPLSVAGEQWLGNECRIRIRVSKAYNKNYSTFGSDTPQNGNFPMYSFNTFWMATETNNAETAKSALDLINVVPNPYYALDDYEESVFENKVKITNVPSKCTVSIFNLSGTLVRKFDNDDPDITTIDWDLRNSAGKLVSGGVYIIHVYAPGIGERTLKWFGSMKTVVDSEF